MRCDAGMLQRQYQLLMLVDAVGNECAPLPDATRQGDEAVERVGMQQLLSLACPTQVMN
jgi:hypothetical protein